MKKILSLILAGLMTVSCAAFVAADDAATEATTDPVQDYAIEFLSNYGIFKGGEGLTNEDDIQRYQMALFVSRISTGWVDDAQWEDGTANDSTFEDINEGAAASYLGAISYANQNGIIEGYSAKTFAPYDGITYRDALTMVVRTLGYKGLSYPWGNIEKAVELGLTDGIDAAYTDTLTRGEVAVIIYNAMFANTSKGVTLAKSIFDVDFGWQNIIVVNSDEYSVIDATDAKGTTGKKVYAPAGYVGFSIIDENGSVGSKVYYVKSEELALEGHEEEQAVCTMYIALFTIDDDLVDILDSETALVKAVVNNGVTDDKGVAYETMPIAAELANFKPVKDYTSDKVSYFYDDLLVYGYESIALVDADANEKYVGIDYTTGDLMYYYGDCKDTANHSNKTTHGKCGWEVEWFYNKQLDNYYQYVVEDGRTYKTGETGELAFDTANDGKVFINWMSDAEFTKWYADIVDDVLGYNTQLKKFDAPAASMKEGKAPYAKLELYNIDAAADADVANYKEYAIGLFFNSSMKCGVNADGINHNNDTKIATYKITTLDNDTVYEQFVEEGHDKHEDNKGEQFAWLTVDPSVTTFDATKASANGEVVLYNVNKSTGEIELVKHITSGTNDDADSKVITGVLQAYSTTKQTITIDGTVYPFNYTNLSGNEYYMADTGIANRTVIGAELDEQYMQYVTAVICDNYVVDTDLLGSDEDFIVVLGYAGITSDGYIAVYGYSTDDLTMKVFKINTYNGWKKGDYRYYPENADEDDAFDFGSLYNIKSFDAETNSYGVYTENVDSALDGAKPVRISFENGYRIVTPMAIDINDDGDYIFVELEDGEATVKKMSSADKYIVVTDDNVTGVASNIYVFEGDDIYTNDSIEGMLVDTKVDNKFVIYTAENAINSNSAFFTNNAYQVGYVLYEKENGQVLDAAYDEAIAEDVYLLGSSLSSVRVMNLLTGNRDTVIASSNIDLVNGHIYKTIGNQILWDITDECGANLHGFITAISGAYSSQNIERATYMVRTRTLTKEDVSVDGDGKTLNTLNLASRFGFNGVENYVNLDDADSVDKAIAAELVKGITLYLVDQDDYDWYGATHGKTAVEPLAWKDMKADYTYTTDLIYEVATGKFVGYIYDIDLDGEDDDDDAINAPAGTKAYTSGTTDDPTLYAGGDPTVAGTEGGHNAMWHFSENDKLRWFDIAADYTVTATFNDEDCQGDVTGLELDKLVLTIKEAFAPADATKATSATNPVTFGDLKSCDDDCAMHSAMAAVGAGFGGDLFDAEDVLDTITVSTNVPGVAIDDFEENDIKITQKPCGLAYIMEIDLSEAQNGHGVELNLNSATNITVRIDGQEYILSLTPEYIYGPSASLTTTNSFVGFDDEATTFTVNWSAKVININATEPAEETYIYAK